MSISASDTMICACRGHCQDPPVSRGMVLLLAILLLVQVRTDTSFEGGINSWSGARGLRILALARSYIRTQYPHPPSDRELYTAALEGMLGRLKDPYTEFLPPEMTRFSMDLLQDQVHGGLGVVSAPLPDGGMLIQELVRGGAAEKAGIQRGDVIIAIDGIDLTRRTPNEAADLMRGPVNTPVSVTTKSTNGLQRTRTLIRQPLPQFGSIFVKWYPQKIFYIRTFLFSDGLHQRIRDAVVNAGQNGMRGLIIDLRPNGGGALEEGLATADLFLKEGPITIIERIHHEDQEARTTRVAKNATPETITDVPIVLLVGRQTASAAELFSGALHDHDRALLIGEKTFGKARIQEIINLPQTQSAIKMTVAFYLTPKGENIDGVGIDPDMSIPLTPEEIRAIANDWQRAWIRKDESEAAPVDPQLDAALRAIESTLQKKEAPQP